MEVTIEEKSTFERVISVTIEANRVDDLLDREIKRLSEHVRMPGFRPGKMPTKLIESRFKEQLQASLTEQILKDSYGQALDDHQLRPANQPVLDIGKIKRGQPFTYTATFEHIPEVNPERYTQFTLTRTSAVVEESDVDKVIEQMRDKGIEYKVEEGRVAAAQDQLQFDFAGRVDGELFDGGSSKKHELILGSGHFIPGFEDQLIGHQAGEEIDVTVTFPEPYQAQHLAGKEAVFHCHIHEVRAPVRPEIDDALAVKAGIKEGGIEKLREQIKDRLRNDANKQTESKLRDEIIQQLLEANPMEVPTSLVSQEQANMYGQLEQSYKSQGLDPAMLGITEQMLTEGFKEEATKRVKTAMLLGSVARKESLEVDDKAVEAYLDEMVAPYGEQAGKMKKHIQENPTGMENIRSSILEASIIEWITQHSTVEEKTCSLDELMAKKPATDDGQTKKEDGNDTQDEEKNASQES